MTTTMPTSRIESRDALESTDNYSAGIDQVRYWVGAGSAAVVSSLAGVAGLILAHGIVHIPVLFSSDGRLSPVHATSYALLAALFTLLAAGLFDGMLHIAPRPALFFGWIVGLITLLTVLTPFATTAALDSKIALAAMNLGIGVIIMILVPMSAVRARR